jgi:hypothetical protein
MSTPIVRLRIGAPILLQDLLHLDEGVTLFGASVDEMASALVLYLRYPEAPAGADEILPVYQRRDVAITEVTGTEWYSDGRKLDAEPS